MMNYHIKLLWIPKINSLLSGPETIWKKRPKNSSQVRLYISSITTGYLHRPFWINHSKLYLWFSLSLVLFAWWFYPFPTTNAKYAQMGFVRNVLKIGGWKNPTSAYSSVRLVIFTHNLADFKLIKRSNTYNAVAAMLKVPC